MKVNFSKFFSPPTWLQAHNNQHIQDTKLLHVALISQLISGDISLMQVQQ